MLAAVGGDGHGLRPVEGLHEGVKPADQGVYSVGVVAARGALRPPPGVKREVRDVPVLRDPLVGDEPARAEHRIGRHRGQQGTGDRRLTCVGNGFERPLAGAIDCREELLLPDSPAPRRRCAR